MKGAMRNKLGFYSRKFLLGSRRIWRIAAFAVYLSLCKVVFKLSQQHIASLVTDAKDEDAKEIKHVMLYFVITLFYIATVISLELVGSRIQNSVFTDAYSYLYTKFLDYDKIDWKTHLGDNLYTVILRRAKGLSKFFKYLFINEMESGMYVLFGGAKLLVTYQFSGQFKLTFLMLFTLPVIITLMSQARRILLRKTNEAYDAAERAARDCFYNYELIHTYNMLNQAEMYYSESLVPWRYWFIGYWIMGSVIDVFKDASSVTIIVILYNNAMKAGIEKCQLNGQMKITQSIMKRLNVFVDGLRKISECNETIENSKLDKLVVSKPAGCVRKTEYNESIVTDGMSMRYGNQLVWEHVDLCFKKGEKIAITGLNGSGKSSFVKGLLGLERYSGRVLIDGVDTRHMLDSDFRRLMGYVPQDATVFDGTAYENITMFDTAADRSSIYEKIAELKLDMLITQLGYDTMLVDGGKNINPALKQTICFLRAMIRDAPVVVFDEMTSNMDKECETRAMDLVMNHMKNKTVIMILHNLDFLPMFDKVVFFNNKTATKCLSYEEQIRECPEFVKYCSKKAHDYCE